MAKVQIKGKSLQVDPVRLDNCEGGCESHCNDGGYIYTYYAFTNGYVLVLRYKMYFILTSLTGIHSNAELAIA
jgi:hypothetical protein